jgi:transglutaminase-like putative cysteine protease
VLRPKGDLLFTLDTYLTSNRRANVELPWQQFDQQTFSLAEDDFDALPLDLQRIAILIARGSYTPASDGSSNADSPLPIDSALAADVAAERETLRDRFLDVHWQVGPDGRAHSLIVSGQAPVYDDVTAVFSQDQVIEGETYVITGLTSTAGPDQLRAAGTDYPSWVSDRYLELPPTITDRTRELARQLAQGNSNAFDTSLAVEQYVRKTIVYNEDIEPPPANQDVVDYVLFDSQQGYCEYYASAMSILLRLEGIPTRVVGGYFPAPFDTEAGGLLYREKNAHLWVEAFFPGYGWIPFEPTANREPLSYGDIAPGNEATQQSTPEPTPEPTAAVATPPPAPQTPPEAPPSFTPPEALTDPGRLAGLVGLALAALLTLGALAITSAWFASFRGLSPVAGFYARALRAGKWLGVPPTPSLTPREYAERVGRAVPSAQGPARVVADLYTHERYAARRPDAEALRRARAAWSDLRGIAVGSLLRGRGKRP